jgi:transposase
MIHDDAQTLMPGISADDLTPADAADALALPPAAPRLRRADRAQVLLLPRALDEMIPADHLARSVWAVVERWDLSAFLAIVAARGERPGRAATDPKVLIGLWLFAYTQGVGRGRELDRLCDAHDAYRWLAGGVSLNYHTINDFRVDHEQALDGLLTQMLATLTAGGEVRIGRIGQDGTRVHAGAGRGSFKKREALEQHLADARRHVEAMKQQAEDPATPAASAQQKAAQERAARERVERLERAMQEIKKVEEAKAAQKEKPSKHEPAKASATDPEARQMRMPGGGTAPGYNVQLAVAVPDGGIEHAAGAAAPARAIVAVGVTNAGSDVHESTPMRKQVEQRLGHTIDEHLIDGGYIGLDAIDEAAADGVTVYAPVPKPKKKDVDPHQPKKTDSEAVAEWRPRMATAEAKSIYKHRAATCETANAECRTYRGLGPMLVRGVHKVRCVALWSALAYNLVHFAALLTA